MHRYTFYEFQQEYPNDDACLNTIMELRYGDKPVCDECKHQTKYHRIRKRRAFACQFCGAHVYPCVGTPFEKSSTPLHKWFYAMYLFTATRHGVSGKELERQLGVSYKCAWRIGHQIRKLMAENGSGGLFGCVEVDESYVGGKRPGKRGRGAEGKTIVFSMKERDGELKTQPVPNVKRRTLEPIIRENVREGTLIHTDELRTYTTLGLRGYHHDSVNHSHGEYAREGCHVNSLEGHWSLFKRSVRGTHVHISAKHMSKYLSEFDFRHNLRKAPSSMFSRLMELLCEVQPA